MRRLNLQLFLALAVGTLVSAAGVYGVHKLQTRRSAGGLLRQAERAEAKGDHVAASQYLERYLAYVPGDVDVLTRYGLLVMPEAPRAAPEATRRAVSAFEKALIRAPDRVDARRRLVDARMGLGDYSAALSDLGVLLSADGKDGGLEILRGECLEALGRYEKAAESYEKARDLAPARVEVYTRLAYLLRRRLNQGGAADLVMDAGADPGKAAAVKGGKTPPVGKGKPGLIAANGGSAGAYLARARYRREFGRPGKEFGAAGADADAAFAVKLAPDDADATAAAAGSSGLRGEAGRAEARALLARGLELHPGNARLYETLAALEENAGRPDAVIAALERAVKALPDRHEFEWHLANALVTGGKTAEAARAIDRFRALKPMPETLEFLEGRLLARQRRWSEAAAKLERAAPSLAARPSLLPLSKEAYLLLGLCQSALGNPDKQETAYRRAVDIDLPGGALGVQARLGLASSLASRDRLDEAAEEYRKALNLPGAPPSARLDLVRVLVLRELRRPRAHRQWSDAERTLDDAEKALPGSPELALLKCETLVDRGRLDEAVALARGARIKAPDRVDLWAAQATLERRAGRPEEALRLADEAERRLGRRVELRLVRAAYWGAKGGPDAARALAELEAGAADLDPNDRRRLLPALAQAYAQAGDPARARALTRRYADEDPANLPLRLTLFDQALLDGDSAAAERLLGEVRRIEAGKGGDRTLGLYGEASLLIWRAEHDKGGDKVGTLEKARRRLAEVARARPKWSRVPNAEAVVDDRQGRTDAALGHYLEAIDLGERSPTTVLRATQLLFERGRYAQADQVLQKLQDPSILTGEQQRLAADLALRSRDYDRALAQARAAEAADPKDFRNPLWLGRILYLVGRQAQADGRKAEAGARLAEAEKAVRRSVGLAGPNPGPRVFLVQILVGDGRKAEAEGEIRGIEKASPAETARLALAQCREAVGDPAKAASLYREAVAANPDDPVTLQAAATFDLRLGRNKEAESVLLKLEAMGKKAPSDAAWARRTRALLVAAGSNPRRTLEALDILGPAGPDEGPGGQAVQDQRARARILSVQANRDRRREAIAILEGLNKGGAAADDDRFLLAQLLDADGDWPKARDLLRGLTASGGTDPRSVSYYANALLRRGKDDEAKVWVARMSQLLPDAPATVELEARLLHAQGRKAEAVARVTGYVKGKDALTHTFAVVLEGLKEYDAAEVLYRRFAARSTPPNAAFPLVLFLGRRGRTREALDLCDAAWAKSDPVAVSNVSVKVVAEAAAPDEATFQRVAARLVEAIRKHPDRDTIQLDLGNLRSFQGRYDEAEAVYRTLFGRAKIGGAALNNMAWLLALRGGKEAEALPLIERAIKIEGETPSLVDTRAVAYMALGRAKDAVRDLENAVVDRPVADVYFHLAQAYRMAGKLDDAGRALKKAKELGLSAADVHPLERASYDRLLTELSKK